MDLIKIFRLDLWTLISLKLSCYRGNFIVTNSLLSWVLNLIKTFTAEQFQGIRLSPTVKGESVQVHGKLAAEGCPSPSLVIVRRRISVIMVGWKGFNSGLFSEMEKWIVFVNFCLLLFWFLVHNNGGITTFTILLNELHVF